jgi:RHS repeat-associated protein
LGRIGTVRFVSLNQAEKAFYFCYLLLTRRMGCFWISCYVVMTPEINDGDAFGGDDGTGGYAPIAIVIGSTLRWVHGNHLGVPIVYTSNTGAVIATPAYTLPGFPGQLRTFADLYYNLYRDYDPTTGRYIQADPIGLAGGQAPYLYAMGNPVRYVDPDGLECLNLFNPDTDPMLYAGAIAQCEQVDPGGKSTDLNVFGHGNAEKICPPFSSCQPAQDFYNEHRKVIDRSRSIIIWACNVGRKRNGAAQSLADLSGKRVTAADKYTWWDRDGMQGVGGREPTWREWFEDFFGEQHMGPYGYPEHHGSRDYGDPGQFQTFDPQRR